MTTIFFVFFSIKVTMVDCQVEIFPGPDFSDINEKGHHLVFRISTPWCPNSVHRTLSGPARKSRNLSLWNETDFLEHIRQNDKVLIFIELVYSKADVDHLLKPDNTPKETLIGMGYINVFNNLLGIGTDDSFLTV